jgi:hypothetical protein
MMSIGWKSTAGTGGRSGRIVEGEDSRGKWRGGEGSIENRKFALIAI